MFMTASYTVEAEDLAAFIKELDQLLAGSVSQGPRGELAVRV
jgi:hypothetical protein